MLITSLLFAADTAESVKTALDLAKVLDAMTDMRAELDDIQVQMALLKAETSERVAEAREEAAARLSRMKSGAAVHAAALKDDTAERLNELVENTMEKMSGFVEGTAEKMGGLVETRPKRWPGQRNGCQSLQRTRLPGYPVRWHSGQRAPGRQYSVTRLTKVLSRIERINWPPLSQRLVSITEKRHMLSTHMDFYQRGILKGNPTLLFPVR